MGQNRGGSVTAHHHMHHPSCNSCAVVQHVPPISAHKHGRTQTASIHCTEETGAALWVDCGQHLAQAPHCRPVGVYHPLMRTVRMLQSRHIHMYTYICHKQYVSIHIGTHGITCHQMLMGCAYSGDI